MQNETEQHTNNNTEMQWYTVQMKKQDELVSECFS